MWLPIQAPSVWNQSCGSEAQPALRVCTLSRLLRRASLQTLPSPRQERTAVSVASNLAWRLTLCCFAPLSLLTKVIRVAAKFLEFLPGPAQAPRVPWSLPCHPLETSSPLSRWLWCYLDCRFQGPSSNLRKQHLEIGGVSWVICKCVLCVPWGRTACVSWQGC